MVPFNNTFRRLVVNPTLRAFYALWKLRGRGLGFTEFRYSRAEMDGFLARTNFETLRVFADDFLLPWSKGLFVDLCDVGSFVHYEHKPPYEFGAFGTAVVRAIQSVGPLALLRGHLLRDARPQVTASAPRQPQRPGKPASVHMSGTNRSVFPSAKLSKVTVNDPKTRVPAILPASTSVCSG